MASGKLRFKLKIGVVPTVPANFLPAVTTSASGFRVDMPEDAVVAQLFGIVPMSTKALIPDDGVFYIDGDDIEGWFLKRGATEVTANVDVPVQFSQAHPDYVNSPRLSDLLFNVVDIPTAGNLYLGALTPYGFGEAFGENYAGTGYLKVENASGNGQTKLRYNRRNQLVFAKAGRDTTGANAVTTSATAPTDIAATYTFDAVEYTDAACTIPTGNSYPRTLYTTGDFTTAGATVSVGAAALQKALAPVTIPLAKARFACDWPLSDDVRYGGTPGTYGTGAAAGDVMFRDCNASFVHLGTDTAKVNQVFAIQALTNRKLGEFLVLCPGGHNEPFPRTTTVSGVTYNGTFDLDVRPSINLGSDAGNTLANFGGTFANGFAGTNPYQIVQIDPANTRMGYFAWSSGTAYTRIHNCYFLRTRASLSRTSGAPDTSNGGSQGVLHFASATTYIEIYNNAIDCVAFATPTRSDDPTYAGSAEAARYANGIYLKSALHHAVNITANMIGRSMYPWMLQGGVEFGLPSQYLFLEYNENTGEHGADVFHPSGWYDMYIRHNLVRDRRFAGGIHPDYWQPKMPANITPGNYNFGEIAYNRAIPGIDSPEATGQGIFTTAESADVWWVNGHVHHNFISTHKQNGMMFANHDGLLVEFNTIIQDPNTQQLINGKVVNAENAYISIDRCKNTTARYNIAPSSSGELNDDDGLQSGVDNNGTDAATNTLLSNRGGIRNAAAYTSAGLYTLEESFAAPVHGAEPVTQAATAAAFARKSTATHLVATDGTEIGCFATDGSYSVAA